MKQEPVQIGLLFLCSLHFADYKADSPALDTDGHFIRQAVKDMVAHKIVNVLGCDGKA